MKNNEPKTVLNDKSVESFLSSVTDEQQREDARAINTLMTEITGEKPNMWGDSIIGYGTYHYLYASGREGDWMKIGFSPRKGKISLYLMDGIVQHTAELEKLGPYKAAKACLYIKRLADVDIEVLRRIIKKSYDHQAMGQQE